VGLAVSGAVLGALTAACFGLTADRALLSLIATITLPAGYWAGQLAWKVIEAPSPRRVRRLVLVVGITIPVALGGIDLYLRLSTP
jgi:hypothetical protein